MKNSTIPAKPAKPRPDFPLFPHASGRWAKKIRGQFKYFGKVADDPDGKAALELWLEQKDDLLSGRTPRPKSDELTIRELLDRFMVSKRAKMDSDELTAASFGDYFSTCKRIIAAFGRNRIVADLAPEDFQKFRASMAHGWSPVTLANEINRVRVVFHYAEQNHLVTMPIRYGSEFKRPTKKILRAARQAKGKRMLQADELRKLIAAATVPLKAMLLLAANMGMGNTDCATLQFDHLDLDKGWYNTIRHKTSVPRRAPLWPETVKAIQDAIKDRPMHRSPELAQLVFITRYGKPWSTVTLHEADPENGRKETSVTSDDPICKETSKLLKTLGLKRPGIGFYAIRHGFETVGGASRDQPAVDLIMGHDRGDMASIYREDIDDDRLQAVADQVHAWLWPVEQKDETK